VAGLQGIDPRLRDAFQRTQQAWRQQFPDLPRPVLTSGYRSLQDQQRLYNQRFNNPNPVAKPGSSKHETGGAVDVGFVDSRGNGVNDPRLLDMFAQLGTQYGLSRPVKNDKVHFEYSSGATPTNPRAQVQQQQQQQQPANKPIGGGLSPEVRRAIILGAGLILIIMGMFAFRGSKLDGFVIKLSNPFTSLKKSAETAAEVAATVA
jgi:hypothetical protein